MSDKKFKSIRLSNFLRDDIIDSVLRAYKVNLLAEKDLCDWKDVDRLLAMHKEAAMVPLWGRKYGKYVEALRGIPEELLSNRPFKVMNLRGDCTEILIKGFPGNAAVDMRIDDDDWDSVFKNYNDLLKWKKESEDKCTEFRKEVTPVIYSCNTTQQLVEVWPGIEKFLPANIADPDKGIRLPMLAISRLEEKLNGTVH